MSRAGILSFPDNPFWEFSIRVYAEPGIAETCLALQERHGADINVVLYCLWVAQHGFGRLTRTHLRELLDQVATWRDDVIVPLRTMRNRLKGGMGSIPADHSEIVRSTVKRAELDAEHAEQLFLASLISERRNPDTQPEAAAMDAVENLAQYLSLLKIKSSEQERVGVYSLLAAVFPTVSAEKITILSRFET